MAQLLGRSHGPNTRRKSLSLYKTINSNIGIGESNIIAVTGYGIDPTPTWGLDDEIGEVATALPFEPKLHIYFCCPDYGTTLDKFSWRDFLTKGSDLAEDLAELADKYPERRMVFIAHSLGGVLLKKALNLAHKHTHNTRFSLLTKSLAGILFLGTPHAGTSNKDTLIQFNRLLRSLGDRAVPKQSSLSLQDGASLNEVAATFARTATFPIFSVFESEERDRTDYERIQRLEGLYRSFLAGKKKQQRVLVNERLAMISSHREHVSGVCCPHWKLCWLAELRDPLGIPIARNFLQSVLEEALERPLPLPHGASVNVDTLRLFSHVGSLVKSGNSMMTGSSSLEKPMSVADLLPSTGSTLLRDREAISPCFTLTQLSKARGFTGRHEAIKDIDEFFFSEGPVSNDLFMRPRVFALCGMGGIGKTELAIQYAHIRRDRFDSVFWIEAGGASQLRFSFGQIPKHLGLVSSEEACDVDANIELSRAWLASGKPNQDANKRRWLLIFDNADTLDLITQYIPKTGYGCVLVTSRVFSAKTDLPEPSSGLELDLLNREEASLLLRSLLKREEEHLNNKEIHASVEIACKHDGLPLAIEQMAGFIRKNDLSLSEFLKEYGTDERYKVVRNVAPPTLQSRYGLTLATAWSFDGLSTEALRLLRVLAFLNSERIPEEMFTGPEKGSRRPDRFWTSQNYRDARSKLIGSFIIKRNRPKEEISIHRSIQREVRVNLGQGDGYEFFAEAVQLLRDYWLSQDDVSRRLDKSAWCEPLLPHSEQLYTHWQEYQHFWMLNNIEEPFPSLMNEVAVYLHERGFSHEGKPYLNLALELCELGSIDAEPLVSDIHLSLGTLCNDTNDTLESLEHNFKCLAIRKREVELIDPPIPMNTRVYARSTVSESKIEKSATGSPLRDTQHLLSSGLHSYDYRASDSHSIRLLEDDFLCSRPGKRRKKSSFHDETIDIPAEKTEARHPVQPSKDVEPADDNALFLGSPYTASEPINQDAIDTPVIRTGARIRQKSSDDLSIQSLRRPPSPLLHQEAEDTSTVRGKLSVDRKIRVQESVRDRSLLYEPDSDKQHPSRDQKLEAWRIQDVVKTPSDCWERMAAEQSVPYRTQLELPEDDVRVVEPDSYVAAGATSYNRLGHFNSPLELHMSKPPIYPVPSPDSTEVRLRLATAHSETAIAYMRINKFATATEYFEESICVIESLVETNMVDRDELALPTCNLGLAYWVQGRLQRADDVLTELLEQREERYGKLDRVSHKTGRVLQALGNVKSSKAVDPNSRDDDETAESLFDVSFELHKTCLEQYEFTLGSFNHRTADACHKVAQHHIRRGEHVLAQDHLHRALAIWGDRSNFRGESARTSFLCGKHLQQMGGSENHEKGALWIKRATLLRRELIGSDDKEELQEEDFDNLVCFWSL